MWSKPRNAFRGNANVPVIFASN